MKRESYESLSGVISRLPLIAENLQMLTDLKVISDYRIQTTLSSFMPYVNIDIFDSGDYDNPIKFIFDEQHTKEQNKVILVKLEDTLSDYSSIATKELDKKVKEAQAVLDELTDSLNQLTILIQS